MNAQHLTSAEDALRGYAGVRSWTVKTRRLLGVSRYISVRCRFGGAHALVSDDPRVAVGVVMSLADRALAARTDREGDGAR